MHQAHRELEELHREWHNGRITDEIMSRTQDAILQRYGVERRIVKTYANGIGKVELIDQNGEVIAEYHQVYKDHGPN